MCDLTFIMEIFKMALEPEYGEKLDKIVSHFGIDNQVHKLAEETGELTGAIVRYNGGFLATNNKIRNEMGDVLLVLLQLMRHYKVDAGELLEFIKSKPDEVIEKYYIDGCMEGDIMFGEDFEG